MTPGDRILIHMHDTPAGFQVNLVDLTTGQRGSMTASTANGFGHILYTPNSSTCQEAPYAFHPEYSTANPRRNTWTAHTYNVAMSDELGHFKNCLAIDVNGNCTSPGAQDPTLDLDDTGCVPGTDSSLVMIDGCFTADEDFDGQSPARLAGHESEPRHRPPASPTPVLFTSPVTRGGRNYRRSRLKLTSRRSRARWRSSIHRSAIEHRGQLRGPARRGAVLPVFHHGVPRRGPHLAGRR